MASIRHTLQRELFTPNDEKLLSLCNVYKTYKRKKISILCLTITIDTPSTYILHQIKKNDRNIYKKKQSWQLSDIQIIDGINNESINIELHIDKLYKWSSLTLSERRIFITDLYTYTCNLPQRPEFKNFPHNWFIESITINNKNNIIENINNEDNNIDISPIIINNYQSITDKEADDLNKLIDNCNYAIVNGELFMETLSKDLSILDGENVQLVLASEPQIIQLMNGIDTAIIEAQHVESRLIAYDEALGRIREVMERVGQKNQAIHTANNNARLLLEQLDLIIMQLDISQYYQKILNDAELPGGKNELAIAGNVLLKAISAQLPLGLDKLSAVCEQKRRLDKLRVKFSIIVARHLNNLFIHLGNDVGDVVGGGLGITGTSIPTTSSTTSTSTSSSSSSITVPITNDFILPTHQSVHRELEPYTELMQLLHSLDNKAFIQLKKVYTTTMSKLYQRDLKLFFEDAKTRLINSRYVNNKTMGQKYDDTIGIAPIYLLSNESCLQQSEGFIMDLILDRLLSQLQPVCLAEQAFCIGFFQLELSSGKIGINEFDDNITTNTSASTTTIAATNIISTYSGNSNNGDNISNNDATSPSSSCSTASKKLERQINEELRSTMSSIFPSLEHELNNFILFLDKIDCFWCMYVLVRLSQHVMSAQDTGSFLSMTFASLLIHVKRSFDKFMQLQQQSIRDMKINRRNKCGILPYIENFGPFARNAEKIFRNSVRKIDLEKWYTKLVGTMFDAIGIHSCEHHKTPQEVIKMENFHHLYDLLSQLKISVLDHERKEAKQKYQDALKAYVIQYFGRPLEKLNLFFEGVQAKVGSGVKESEISYQMAFSKQELRRVIKEYPAREVKKGLENLYRKVEKHLCEEENLLQVVWREMQGEFIAQYIYIEELIQRCYPDSMITLEFTIQNILEFFSEIARSH